jgi:squalene-hopene/tetraprenyl-beta-curcumene cyclase
MNISLNLTAELEKAVEQEAAQLLARRHDDGHWAADYPGRPLESALTLYLLRDTGIAADARRILEAYCRAALTGLPTRTVPELDRVVSRIALRAALTLPVDLDDLIALGRDLSGYAHPTHQRKHMLIGALLVLLYPDIGWQAPPPPVRDGTLQRWNSLLMTAVGVLRAPPDADVSPQVDMLARAQDKDGCWQQHILVTAIIALILNRRQVAAESVRRAAWFLVSRIRPDGGVPFITNEDTWVTCLAAQALSEAGVDPAELATTITYLGSAQLDNGGWGMARGVVQADADDTAVAVTVLSRHQNQRGPGGTPGAAGGHLRAGLEYLLSLPNPDGGFPAFLRGGPSEVEITAKVILALLRAAPDDPRVRSIVAAGWKWLAAQQRPDGGYRTEWTLAGTFPVMHVLRAARATLATGPSSSSPIALDTAARGLRFLRDTAVDERGWTLPGGSAVHPLATAYAIGGIAVRPDPLEDTTTRDLLDRAVLTLLEVPADAPVEPDSIGPRPFVFDVPLLYPIYRLIGLAAARTYTVMDLA